MEKLTHLLRCIVKLTEVSSLSYSHSTVEWTIRPLENTCYMHYKCQPAHGPIQVRYTLAQSGTHERPECGETPSNSLPHTHPHTHTCLARHKYTCTSSTKRCYHYWPHKERRQVSEKLFKLKNEKEAEELRMPCRQSTVTYTTKFPAQWHKPFIVTSRIHLIHTWWFSCTVATLPLPVPLQAR